MLTDFQRNEITEHLVYKILAKQDKSGNSEILGKISREELVHYEKIRSLTRQIQNQTGSRYSGMSPLQRSLD